MFELFVVLLIIALISAFAGAVAAFTHYMLLSKFLAGARAEIAKFEALKKALGEKL